MSHATSQTLKNVWNHANNSWPNTPELDDLLQRIQHVSYSANYSNNSNTPTIHATRRNDSDVIFMDEASSMYMDTLIDLELKDVPSSLGLVWSRLSNTSNETCTKQYETDSCNTPMTDLSIKIEEMDLKQVSGKSPVSNNFTFESFQPETTNLYINTKISKKKRKTESAPNYRVRFSHNKFEEIEFKKSNPKSKFIIFK